MVGLNWRNGRTSVCFPLRPDRQNNQDQVQLTVNEINSGQTGKEQMRISAVVAYYNIEDCKWWSPTRLQTVYRMVRSQLYVPAAVPPLSTGCNVRRIPASV